MTSTGLPAISSGMKYLALLVSIGIVFIGCNSSDLPRYSSVLHTRRLIDRYGVLASSEQNAYLKNLTGRLAVAAGKVAPEVTILNSSDSFAFSAGQGTILISHGLLNLLENESELAFVIAHEFAHTVLGHSELVQESGDPAEIDFKSLELEADRYAALLIRTSGYDTSSIPYALIRAHEALHQPAAASHPSLPLRVAKLQTVISLNDRQNLAGSREFTRFKRSLELSN